MSARCGKEMIGVNEESTRIQIQALIIDYKMIFFTSLTTIEIKMILIK